MDISEVQIERAKKVVPAASFVRADMTEVEFPPAHFGAVICLYALIHVPLEEQPGLLRKIFAWLEPRGLFLLITGHEAWTGTERGWLESEAMMYWSHAGAETYVAWLREIGFELLTREYVPEGQRGHELFLLEKGLPAPREPQRNAIGSGLDPIQPIGEATSPTRDPRICLL